MEAVVWDFNWVSAVKAKTKRTRALATKLLIPHISLECYFVVKNATRYDFRERVGLGAVIIAAVQMPFC